MRTTLRYSTALAALTVGAFALAQEPLRRSPTLQERVTELEANVATLQTRFGLESTRPSALGTGESGLALAGRVDALERTLEQLVRDVQRVQNLAENAARDAAQAQREAMAAQQAARDAAIRAR
jgi:hypothetical protein